MMGKIIIILDKNKSVYDGCISINQWKDIATEIQSEINKKYKLIGEFDPIEVKKNLKKHAVSRFMSELANGILKRNCHVKVYIKEVK